MNQYLSFAFLLIFCQFSNERIVVLKKNIFIINIFQKIVLHNSHFVD